jgi:small subunit ribosomal protein S16
MATKIRLTRLGKKKQATYRVVVMDSRKPRDGKYIEQLGVYDPRQEPSVVTIDNERALHWLTTGAQPTERARKLLEISGAWTQFKVARGDIHTVGDAEPAPKAKKAAPKAAPKTPKAVTPAPLADTAVAEEVAEVAETTDAAVKEEEE